MTYSLQGKKVAVIGAGGLTGSALTNRLVDMEVDVYPWYHLKAPLGKRHGTALDYAHCENMVSDMNVIFHVAAVSSGAKIMKGDPLCLVQPNLVMGANLLEAARHARVEKFIGS